MIHSKVGDSLSLKRASCKTQAQKNLLRGYQFLTNIALFENRFYVQSTNSAYRWERKIHSSNSVDRCLSGDWKGRGR